MGIHLRKSDTVVVFQFDKGSEDRRIFSHKSYAWDSYKRAINKGLNPVIMEYKLINGKSLRDEFDRKLLLKKL